MACLKERNMRIVIDGSCITGVRAGIGNYTYSLLKELLKTDLSNTYTLLSKSQMNELTFPESLKQPDRINLSRNIYKYLPFDSERLNGRFDLYHEPNYIPRIFKGKIVTTICDMSYKLFPQYHPRRRVMTFNFFENRMRNSDRIITISENSKQEIIELLKVPEEKVVVTYLGASEDYKPIEINPEQKHYFRKTYGLPDNYLLYVGTIEPRKNLSRLIEAFYLFKKETTTQNNIKLVLAGGKGWLFYEIFSRVQELKIEDQIVFTGYVPDEHLPYLYNMAMAFVYPSIYEGFGLPPLEAMSCGIPVISSNTSSIPEVVGAAGILIDPYNVTDLAEAMSKVVQSKSLRAELSQKGLSKASQFSWAKCAEETLKIYKGS